MTYDPRWDEPELRPDTEHEIDRLLQEHIDRLADREPVTPEQAYRLMGRRIAREGGQP